MVFAKDVVGGDHYVNDNTILEVHMMFITPLKSTVSLKRIMVVCASLLVLGLSAGPAWAETDTNELENRALQLIEASSEQLAALGGTDLSARVEAAPLPDFFKTSILQALEVAALNIGPEEKAALLVETTGANCNDLLYATAVAIAIDIFIDDFIFNIPFIELAGNILAAATVLCFLGII